MLIQSRLVQKVPAQHPKNRERSRARIQRPDRGENLTRRREPRRAEIHRPYRSAIPLHQLDLARDGPFRVPIHRNARNPEGDPVRSSRLEGRI